MHLQCENGHRVYVWSDGDHRRPGHSCYARGYDWHGPPCGGTFQLVPDPLCGRPQTGAVVLVEENGTSERWEVESRTSDHSDLVLFDPTPPIWRDRRRVVARWLLQPDGSARWEVYGRPEAQLRVIFSQRRPRSICPLPDYA